LALPDFEDDSATATVSSVQGHSISPSSAYSLLHDPGPITLLAPGNVKEEIVMQFLVVGDRTAKTALSHHHLAISRSEDGLQIIESR
jgi:hypothetical protein